jgi:excisionase family DNA binding protein
MHTGKLLLSEREAWEMLGIGRSTLRRLHAEGKLRRIKIGRAVRYTVSGLEHYVDQLTRDQGSGDISD